MADSFVPVTFVADELLTSTKMNLLAANQAGFHDGTALGDGIIVTRHLGSAANLVIPTSNFAGKNDFSTSEVDTGYKWIDGKTIYRKTVNCGTMPNSSTTATNHGITGLTAVVEYRGIGFNISGMQFIDFQQGNGTNTYIDATKINIATTIERSQFTAYMTLWYTK